VAELHALRAEESTLRHRQAETAAELDAFCLPSLTERSRGDSKHTGSAGSRFGAGAASGSGQSVPEHVAAFKRRRFM
jgi:hypothetical protein